VPTATTQRDVVCTNCHAVYAYPSGGHAWCPTCGGRSWVIARLVAQLAELDRHALTR